MNYGKMSLTAIKCLITLKPNCMHRKWSTEQQGHLTDFSHELGAKAPLVVVP